MILQACGFSALTSNIFLSVPYLWKAGYITPFVVLLVPAAEEVLGMKTRAPL